MNENYHRIISDLKKRIYKNVYFLHGDEPYYIDLIIDFIEENVLIDILEDNGRILARNANGEGFEIYFAVFLYERKGGLTELDNETIEAVRRRGEELKIKGIALLVKGPDNQNLRYVIDQAGNPNVNLNKLLKTVNRV